MAIHPKPVEHHIPDDRAFTRLCDGAPAIDADISSEDLFELRDAHTGTLLCVRTARTRVDPQYVQSELYGGGPHTTAHLYAVPVLEGFDAVRN